MPTDAQTAGGHKANINNPNTSKESKENSKKVWRTGSTAAMVRHRSDVVFHMKSADANEFRSPVPKANESRDKNPGNVAGGLKA
jgi:hypothetical protein